MDERQTPEDARAAAIGSALLQLQSTDAVTLLGRIYDLAFARGAEHAIRELADDCMKGAASLRAPQ